MRPVRPLWKPAIALLALFVLSVGPAKAQEAAPPQAQPARPSGGGEVFTITEQLVGGVGGVAVDRAGDIYAADFRETVYKINPDGRARVFATGLYGASGNAIDSRGNLLQANFYGHSITRIDRHGNQEFVTHEGLQGPVGIAVDPEDNMYVCNCRGNYIARVTPSGEVSRLAEGDLFNCPNGITFGPNGALYVVNFADERMIKIDPEGNAVEFATIPGGGSGHVAFARGNLYATSFQGQRVYRVSLAGDVQLFAGTGAIGAQDGPVSEATFSWPNGIAAGPLGDRLYVNDYLNRFPPTMAVPPVPKTTIRVIKLASITDSMTAALQASGIEAMQQAHAGWKAAPATASLNTEVEMNAFGYRLMATGNLAAAVAVFELNAGDYPNSWNAWDSFGEGLMNAGRTAEAIDAYERSVELNPGNSNGVEMLERLRSRD